MGHKALIVESPTKAKTIARYLGKEFKVVSTVGHIRDLPKSSLGVDVDNNFEPEYQNIRGKAKTIKALKDAIKDADEIYLATDPDREGEAIAWHVAQILKKPVKRVEYQEVTKKAVLEALKNPHDIDVSLVDAYQARRVLDRLVGYQISPLMWRKIKPGLSAGRVQSVAVRLICEREEEIRSFNREEYWNFEADFSRGSDRFSAALVRIGDQRIGRPSEDHRREEENGAESGRSIIIRSKEEADRILADANQQSFSVSDISSRKHTRRPQPPFITSTLQQDAARRFGWSGKRSMRIAQQLYEGIDLGSGAEGLITYMRTDSVRVNPAAIEDARALIRDRFGDNFLPAKPGFYKSKKDAQDAHEAIRPTSAMRSPESLARFLNEDQMRIYRLIWQRFIASQMKPAEFETHSIEISGGDYTFRLSSTNTLFKGFLEVYGDARNEAEQAELPPMEPQETVQLEEMRPSQHFTKPPPRFTDASLIKAMEEYGIGRPSTYASIIDTIIFRNYVVRVQKQFQPTEWGFVTTEMMEHYFPEIVDVGFTRDMEVKLDDVEEGKIDWRKVLGNFYTPFKTKVDAAGEEKKYFKAKPQETEHKCDKCGSVMLLRHGKFGRFLSCSAYPDCSNIKNIDEKGNIIDRPVSEAGQKVEYPCPKCGKELSVKVSRWGTKFIGCSGYPKCDYTSELQTKCPKCQGELHKKRLPNRRVILVCGNNEKPDGEKVGKCDFVLWGKPLLEKCEKCGFWLAEQKIKGTDRFRRYCSNATCDNHKGIFTDEDKEEEGAAVSADGADE